MNAGPGSGKTTTVVEFALDYRSLGYSREDFLTRLYWDFEAVQGGPKSPNDYRWNDRFTGPEAQFLKYKRRATLPIIAVEQPASVARDRWPALIRLTKGQFDRMFGVVQINAPQIFVDAAQLSTGKQRLAIGRPANVMNPRRKLHNALALGAGLHALGAGLRPRRTPLK